MTDYDATAHITEEMKNPAIKAPVGILAALGVTYVLGFGLNIALSVNMGPKLARSFDHANRIACRTVICQCPWETEAG